MLKSQRKNRRRFAYAKRLLLGAKRPTPQINHDFLKIKVRLKNLAIFDFCD